MIGFFWSEIISMWKVLGFIDGKVYIFKYLS
jgi:hypothetical protein